VKGGRRAQGRNDPNNVCTYEYMNKKRKKRKRGRGVKTSV
jgi:hypothetical protein